MTEAGNLNPATAMASPLAAGWMRSLLPPLRSGSYLLLLGVLMSTELAQMLTREMQSRKHGVRLPHSLDSHQWIYLHALLFLNTLWKTVFCDSQGAHSD